MTTFVIIPVKKLDDAKSRLSPLLLNNERKEFCLKMLEDVLTTVKTTRHIDQTVVVSRDAEAFRVAKRFDAAPLMEGQPGLNQAVSEAVSWCIQRGATSTLVLPADIPLVTPIDLNRILSFGEKAAVVISPSRSGNGTNALLLTPPNVIPTFYGQHSFQRHVKEASMRGIRLRTLRSSRIALDIDTVEDLAYFAALKPQETRSHRFLAKIGVLKRLRKPP
ncbi:MAG: 2-phospho-L-lactate guanylyltransferase [Candidatus Bathyarchaeia archaeon]